MFFVGLLIGAALTGVGAFLFQGARKVAGPAVLMWMFFWFCVSLALVAVGLAGAEIVSEVGGPDSVVQLIAGAGWGVGGLVAGVVGRMHAAKTA
jgi:hypothetical protein